MSECVQKCMSKTPLSSCEFRLCHLCPPNILNGTALRLNFMIRQNIYIYFVYIIITIQHCMYRVICFIIHFAELVYLSLFRRLGRVHIFPRACGRLGTEVTPPPPFKMHSTSTPFTRRQVRMLSPSVLGRVRLLTLTTTASTSIAPTSEGASATSTTSDGVDFRNRVW